jgi:diguanylate cyclase (GGDEF)-like protein/PAS domain S-box-containing protein
MIGMAKTLPQLNFLAGLPKESLYSFIELYTCGMVFLNTEGCVLFANKSARTMSGFTLKEIKTKHLPQLSTAEHHNVIEKVFTGLVTSRKNIIAGTHFQSQLLTKTGGVVPVDISFNKIQHKENSLVFFTLSDVSAQVELQQQLYHQAITDPLTGLYNRRYFDEKLSSEFKRANRYRRSFSTIIIDIDGFKQANDLYGHSFGDEMLVKATELFKRVLRDGDTIYRYGGDEFAMILPETPKEGCLEVAERLREAFARNYAEKKQRIKLSLSIGIASYPEDGIDQRSLIGAADSRMYHSKENGGNMITAYDSNGHQSHDIEPILRALHSLAHLTEKNRGFMSNSTGINHSQGIRSLSVEIGHAMGLPAKTLYWLEQAAMLHDIGIITIPPSILAKPGKLTEEEWDTVKKHTLVGEEIIAVMGSDQELEFGHLKTIVGQHHEKMDGSGYPRALRSDEILIEAKILATADAYAGMLSSRPYRKSFTKKRALAELKKFSGTYYDAEVVAALIKLETSK